jgi:uncharacterized protein (DUF2267 family)
MLPKDVARRRTAALVALAGAGLLALLLVVLSRPTTRRRLRRRLRAFRRKAAYLRGRMAGVCYRLSGRHPDPDVDDHVLADRVRSALGPLEQRLDTPRVHVTCQNHIVFLHGNVDSEAAEQTLVDASLAISGVRVVQSELHVGLARGDTRPSQGRAAAPPSATRRKLLRVAGDVGPAADDAVGAVLSAFLQRIPEGERRHVDAHLPADVRALVSQETRHPPVEDLSGLGAAVVERTGLPLDRGVAIAGAVLGALRDAVADEADDIAAVLPEPLRSVWTRAGAGQG